MLKKTALDYFKKPKKIAEILMLSPAAVSQWGDVIPEKNAYRLQEITDGELKVDKSVYRKITKD